MDTKREQETIDADGQIRNYYENQPPSQTEAFPAPLEMVSAQRAGKVERIDDDLARLSGGDPDVSQQGIDSGEETPGGSNPTPDQDLVDEIGKAAGVTYEDKSHWILQKKQRRETMCVGS